MTSVSHEINHLYRNEYGKLVSVLTKIFGSSNIKLAEDVVQDAMLEAVKQWSYKGVPENPVGWIYKVAKNKAVNIVNREKLSRKHNFEITNQLESEDRNDNLLEDIFSDEEIADDQLRMIFTCCQPTISKDSQIALTLKTLCGFSVSEIAKAFFTTEENINKRLVRARKNIRDSKVPFEVPLGKDLENRLHSVLEIIYLLFNEGYNASSGDDLIKYELCEEAIRLAEIIVTNSKVTKTSNVYALLALMSLNTARFSARIDEFDNLIDLQHQDRSKWNKDLIKKGLNYLEFATVQNEVSLYHILATISAHYSIAKNYESTDWKGILSMYDLLLKIDNSPVVKLNRAIVISKTKDVKVAINEIERIKEQSLLKSYLPYYTAKAELHFQNDEPEKARELLKKALKITENNKAKQLIINKLLLNQ